MPAYQQLGGEIWVSQGGADNSSFPSVTALSNGGYVVVWSQQNGDPYDDAVYAHVFGPGGVSVTDPFRVNTHIHGSQNAPDVAALANGGFVVSWTDTLPLTPTPDDDSGFAVRSQIYTATGAKVGSEFLVPTTLDGDQAESAIAGLSGGGFVVLWADGSGNPDPDTVGVRGQIFDATGAKVGAEIIVPQNPRGEQIVPDVVGLPGGGFVAVWADNGNKPGDTSEFGVVARLFDASGAPTTGEFVVNTSAYLYQFIPHVTSLSGGGFVVTWYDESETGVDDSGLSVKAQMYDAAGTRVGGELLVNTNIDLDQYRPAVAGLPDGGFVITWDDYSGVGGDTDGIGVKAQVFDSTGAKSGPEFLVNTSTAHDQGPPGIATLANGDFVVVWHDPSEYEGARLVRAQVFTAAAPDPGTNDTLTGTAGADTLSGLNGDDILSGLGGNDNLYGGAGNDVLKGGAGDDMLAGGLGVDTADYSELRTVGVTIDLSLNTGGQDTGGGGFDTFANIENLVGSRVDDSLTGDGGANVLRGQAGNDHLFGGGGDDFLYGDAGDDALDGGAGFDTLAGGLGHDTFVFTAFGTNALIKDWQAGEVIDVSALFIEGLQITHMGGKTFARFDIDGDGQYDDGLIVIQNSGVTAEDFHI
ncbi:MAG: hypothetical protein JWP35_3275 [Caulobacter sp.]|nr:hypothetical protein [Caulobacter sp.]